MESLKDYEAFKFVEEVKMNTIWSTCVQSIGTLYESRVLRFADMFKSKYTDAFKIEDKTRILEIGCGPGALADSLSRWYPSSYVTAIDRDSNFIEFAKSVAPHIGFAEGDATELPYENNSFDVTISNTVAEHIEPEKFYGEQYRVLREGGVCLVLSARRGINISAQCIREETDFEKEIWKRVDKYYKEINEKYAVCAYPQSEMEMPLCMEQYGFKNVITDYVTINLTPDNPIYPKEMAYAMINANRKCAVDNVDSLGQIGNGVVSASEIDELKRIVNEKYNKRIELYNKGIKQWDTNLSVTMIMRGVKSASLFI